MIQLVNLSKRYHQQMIFQDFNCTFDLGVHAIMGPSGSGKTTLINLLLGLTSPDGGAIQGLTGKTLTATFQEDRLIEHATALDNVLLPATNKAKEMAISLLKAVGLGEVIHKKVNELSGGMKRRVAICRSLINPFDILVLDEPFKGLDPQTCEKVMDLIKPYGKSKTVLLITHHLHEANYLDARITSLSC